jgi:DNA-binding NtrC family response regulator
MEVLIAYSWPGNVRELENTIERAVILAKQEYITMVDLPVLEQRGKIAGELAESNPLTEARASLEKDFILQLLARYNWNITRAVKESGISRSQFYRLLTKYQIRRTDMQSV